MRSQYAIQTESIHNHHFTSPKALLDRVKIEANKRDMPYQSLIKAWQASTSNSAPLLTTLFGLMSQAGT